MFLPAGDALSRVFRGKFLRGTAADLFDQDKLEFHGSLDQIAETGAFRRFLRQLFARTGSYTPSRPSAVPEHVLKYLARYTHRVAISNHRFVSFEKDRVSFRWRDYAHGGKQKVMTVSAEEFLRRFLLHVLPRGLVRIRHFGLFANRNRTAALARCRELLGTPAISDPPPTPEPHCPSCSGSMVIMERLSCAQLFFRMPTSLSTGSSHADTS